MPGLPSPKQNFGLLLLRLTGLLGTGLVALVLLFVAALVLLLVLSGIDRRSLRLLLLLLLGVRIGSIVHVYQSFFKRDLK